MTPEGKVKKHLKDRVKALGGELRFVKYIGRRNCPDCRVMFPNGEARTGLRAAGTSRLFVTVRNCWVETKAADANGSLSTGQAREIKRMRDMGEVVLVLLSIEDIDREFPAP